MKSLIIVTKQGTIIKMPMDDLKTKNDDKIVGGLNLSEGDEVVSAVIVEEHLGGWKNYNETDKV